MRAPTKEIKLDCAPFMPRPGDCIGAVVKGTVLEKHLGKPTAMAFGCWTWSFPQVSSEDWLEAKKVIGPRVKKLYEEGRIRYGSW